MEKKLLDILKKITNKSNHVMALPLDSENIKKGLDLLIRDENFKKLKKDFFKVRNELANKIDLDEDHANSLMNYALHYEKLK
jgi:hypothetical protein